MTLNRFKTKMLEDAGGFALTGQVKENYQIWDAVEGQDTFEITVGKYQVGSKTLKVIVDGIPQDPDSITEISNTTFQLPEQITNINPEKPVRVVARWFESALNISLGHNLSHYKDGQDPLDVRLLDGYEDVQAAINNIGDPSVFISDGTSLSEKTQNEFNKRAFNISKWANLKVVVSGGYDWSPVFQAAFKYIMERGGGCLLLPDDNYWLYADVYTHPSNLDPAYVNSPLTVKGVTPIIASLYNTVKTSARIIKKQNGSCFGINYNETTQAVLTGTGVARNIYMKNLDFYGGGTYDSKYTKVMRTVNNVKGIEKHNAAAVVEDCHFWAMDWGVYDPETINGVDNYCDQSTYRRLGFDSMGTGWIQAYRSDASIFEGIYGYDMAMTCQYGIRVKKGEAFSIKGVLCAGKAMHLANSFDLVSAEYCNSFSIENPYMERVEGLGVFLDNCKNVEIKEMGVRHYGTTYIKGTNNRNVKIKRLYAHVEEGKILDQTQVTGDPGDYTVYKTVSLPVEIDFDSTNINIQYEDIFLRNGVHSGGTFTETSARTVPRLNTSSKATFQIGDQYIFDVIYDGSKFVASVGGVQIAFGTLFASSNPTFNTSTGELTFPTDGAFTNLSASNVSGRRSASGVVNFSSKISSTPLVVRAYNYVGGALITNPTDVAFSVTLHV